MLNTMEDLCLICSSSREAGMLPAESSLYCSEGTDEREIVGTKVKWRSEPWKFNTTTIVEPIYHCKIRGTQAKKDGGREGGRDKRRMHGHVQDGRKERERGEKGGQMDGQTDTNIAHTIPSSAGGCCGNIKHVSTCDWVPWSKSDCRGTIGLDWNRKPKDLSTEQQLRLLSYHWFMNWEKVILETPSATWFSESHRAFKLVSFLKVYGKHSNLLIKSKEQVKTKWVLVESLIITVEC